MKSQSGPDETIEMRSQWNIQKRETPRGTSLWNSVFSEEQWKNTLLLFHTFCLENKMKEIHVEMLLTINPSNFLWSRYTEVDADCTLCNNDTQTLLHWFDGSSHSIKLWSNLEEFRLWKAKSKWKVNVRMLFQVLMTKMFSWKDEFTFWSYWLNITLTNPNVKDPKLLQSLIIPWLFLHWDSETLSK